MSPRVRGLEFCTFRPAVASYTQETLTARSPSWASVSPFVNRDNTWLSARVTLCGAGSTAGKGRVAAQRWPAQVPGICPGPFLSSVLWLGHQTLVPGSPAAQQDAKLQIVLHAQDSDADLQCLFTGLMPTCPRTQVFPTTRLVSDFEILAR